MMDQRLICQVKLWIWGCRWNLHTCCMHAHGSCALLLLIFHTCSNFTEINITYHSPRGDDLDTRLLRANILKGVLEETTTATVNLVNADLLAKARGLK